MVCVGFRYVERMEFMIVQGNLNSQYMLIKFYIQRLFHLPSALVETSSSRTTLHVRTEFALQSTPPICHQLSAFGMTLVAGFATDPSITTICNSLARHY